MKGPTPRSRMFDPLSALKACGLEEIAVDSRLDLRTKTK